MICSLSRKANSPPDALAAVQSTGCQKRCVRAKVTGAQEALTHVADWADRCPSAHSLVLDELADTCAALLTAQEKPPSRGVSAGVERRPIVHDVLNEAEGGWDAADAAFADDMFKTGCFMFTQFYKGNS